MSALEQLRTQWIAERPRYHAFALHVMSILERETRARGIICTVTARAKAVDSLVKKAIRKAYEAPWDQITDKAGVRVTTTYVASLSEVETVVRDYFVEHQYENKTLSAEADRFGYQGIHFDVSLREPGEFPDLRCEIQLHTRAQNMWADVSHQLSYKPDGQMGPTVARSINRLVALMEIFDKEVGESRETLMRVEGYEEAFMLAQLERSFYVLTARDFDRELSLDIIGHLKELYTAEEIKAFGPIMDEFVNKHRDRLAEVFEMYAHDERCNPLLFQPESLLTFERLEKNQFQLEHCWIEWLPEELLASLANVWGTSIH
jgi:ppGpp synthetase/RelA/SpoT-type nucleotidyltranferase